MTDIEDRLRQVLTTEATRTQPSTLRPPPTAALAPTRRPPARRAGRDGWPRARRWLAPAAAAAAVVVIIAAVSLAGIGGKPAPATRAGAAAMPRFYVSVIFRPQARAAVHDSRTGRVLSSIMLPKALHVSQDSASGHVAAAASGRTFAITATEILGHHTTEVRVLLLRVSPDGRTDHLTVTPLRLTRPGTRDFVNGIALSPDGGKLAAAVQIPTDSPAHRTPPYAEIKVVSLTGSFPARTWTTRQQYALPLSPSWEADGRFLGFVWDGRITGPALKHIGVTQVRLLDTAVPGTDILASKILAQGSPSLGAIQTGQLAPDGRSVLVATSRNIPASQGKGTAILKVTQLSVPGGHVTRVLIRHAVPYRGGPLAADLSCNVWSVSAQGQHALLACPGFGRLDSGKFTRLPAPAYQLVAW
jgi:hypothetical protein